MNIELHIESLVIEGLEISHAQRAVLQAALEAELSRLITSSGLPAGLQSGESVPSLTAPRIQAGRQNDPAQLGQQIAQSVYGGLSQWHA
jgi:hypothetical protein